MIVLLKEKAFWVFLMSFLFSFHFAQAAETDSLRMCQQKVGERINELTTQPVKVSRLNNLENCVGSLLDLNNPKILAEEGVHIEGFQCGFWCNEQTSFQLLYMAVFTGRDDYINLITTSVSEEERANFESVHFGGIEAFVSHSYDDYYAQLAAQRKPGRGRPQDRAEKFAVLKKIIVDFTEAYFISELRAMNTKNSAQFNLEAKAKEYSQNLRVCFNKAASSSQIEYCVDQLKIFGAADSGKYILQQNLEAHLLPEVSATYYEQVKKLSLAEYNRCLVGFFFSDEEPDKPVQKIKACVYSAMIDAFKVVANLTVSEELSETELDQNQLQQLVAQGIQSCERKDILQPQDKTAEFYKILMGESPESAKQILLSCRDNLENHLVKDIAIVTIQNHPQIKEFVGPQAGALAQEIMDKYFNVCVEKLKASGQGPRACENYLMAATVFEIFENHIDEKVLSLIQTASAKPLSKTMVTRYLDTAKEKIRGCKEPTMQNVLVSLGIKKEQAESMVVGCLKSGFYVFVDLLAREIFKDQIGENAVLKKYNIEIGENKMGETMLTFNQCFQSVTQSSQSIDKLIEDTEWALEKCQLEATKEVVLFALDLILVQELQRTGITEEQVKGVLDTYKGRDSNLFKSIENARTAEELDTLTATGDFEVVKAIAYNVIYLIIRKDTKDYMSQDKTKEFALKASESVIACAKDKSLADCQALVTPDIMSDIIIYLIPIEVERQFREAAKSLLTRRQLDQLGVAALVKWWLTPGQTNTGTALVRYMVEQIAKGKSISSVQASFEVRNRIFIILTESKNFFGRFLKAIIQPELDKAKNEPMNPLAKFFRDLFVSQEVYVWDNIVITPSGQQVAVQVKSILNKVIVDGKQITQQDKEVIVDLVTRAAKEYNGMRR